MKSSHLKIVACFTLVPAFVAAPAVADDNWYAAIRGGLSSAEKSSLDDVSSGLRGHAEHGTDLAIGLGLGYDLGDLRVEGEILHLRNDVDEFAFSNDGGLGAALVGVNDADSGSTRATAGMFNLLYDIDTGSAVTPYLGAGLGWGKVKFNNYAAAGSAILDDSDSVMAYQLIAGLRARVSQAVDLTAGYRYFGTEDPKLTDALGQSVDADFNAHVFLVGLVWKFGGKEEVASVPEPVRTVVTEPRPEPEPEAIPEVEPAAGPEPVGPFIVYFPWDSAELTPEAQAEIRRAAVAAKENAPVKLLLKGHADTSGPDDYNNALSERRAAAVRNALISEGVPAGSIETWGYGEGSLAVWTEDGVRESMNRRVEIIFE
ncbi:MAG: OmpA family protein [Alphaproteobacteria bacterium]|nr:MAG: OmpA family protein [Alphaproteobacteria bacterium]